MNFFLNKRNWLVLTVGSIIVGGLYQLMGVIAPHHPLLAQVVSLVASVVIAAGIIYWSYWRSVQDRPFDATAFTVEALVRQDKSSQAGGATNPSATPHKPALQGWQYPNTTDNSSETPPRR